MERLLRFFCTIVLSAGLVGCQTITPTSDNNLADIHLAMAYDEEKIGNVAAADHDYRMALRLAADRGEVHNNYGVFLCRQKNYQAAMQQFDLASRAPHYQHRKTAHKNAKICKMQADKRNG